MRATTLLLCLLAAALIGVRADEPITLRECQQLEAAASELGTEHKRLIAVWLEEGSPPYGASSEAVETAREKYDAALDERNTDACLKLLWAARNAEAKRNTDKLNADVEQLKKNMRAAWARDDASTIRYIVTGTACSFSVTYATENGGSAQKNPVQSMWSYSFRPKRGDHLYISAGNNCDTGSVHVEIRVGNKVVRSTDSDGAYVNASANGTY